MVNQFLGYPRPDGSVGVRNYVLVLPGGLIASKICEFVPGTRTLVTGNSATGHTSRDRRTLGRLFAGLGMNPNVAGVILHNADGMMLQPELRPELLAAEIRKTGKPVEIIDGVAEGGGLGIIKKGIEVAREMAYQAGRVPRQPFDLSHLTVAVKCGNSDPTSGMAGNAAVGDFYDRIVAAGGTALFGEATEIIGAEHVVARRAINQEVANAILETARFVEDRALATGEDIRTLNPIPSNIQAGISSLEEKALGAIHKAGSQPIQGVLQYCERPAGKGLYFVHNWASQLSIFQGYAAAGAQVLLYQFGGGGVAANSLLEPSFGIVSPMLWCSANPYTRDRYAGSLDFFSGTILEGRETLREVGERLQTLVLETASGALTRGETINYAPATTIYPLDHVF